MTDENSYTFRNPPSFLQLRSEVLSIKKHVINCCYNRDFKPEIKDLEEIVMVKVELEDTLSVAVKLIQILMERTMWIW